MDASGVAAATAVRVAADGTQTLLPVFDCSKSPCIAIPIDTSGDPVYLSFYATGLGLLPASPFNGSLQCNVPGQVTYASTQTVRAFSK